jgi:PD-(D/E)XK nuclease superfamily
MIDERNRIIYYDHSGGATFQACKEKHRLAYFMGWQPTREDYKLSFGHAIHAGWAAYYDALAGGFRAPDGSWNLVPDIEPVTAAQAAFLRDLRINADGTTLPLTLESEERRSIERGLALLRTYIRKWKSEPYANILRPDGSPLTEVGFQFHLADYAGYRIVHVGIIDRIMQNVMTGRPTIVEGKTTTQSISQFIQQVKPNNQITTYFKPANEMAARLGFSEIRECLWDVMFISDRKPDLEKGLHSPGWAYGIDIDKDFARTTTTRSRTDISELLVDAESVAIDYAKWMLSGIRRWPRTTGACHMYGGCQFRRRCSLNLDEVEEQAYMASSDFTTRKWEPWRKIVLEQ